MEAPLGVEHGAGRGFFVNEEDGVVVIARGGVVEGKVKDTDNEVGVGGAGRVVEVASPVGDAAKLVGVGEGREKDVLWDCTSL